MRKAYPWSAEHSRALSRRCEDTRFFAPLFQSGLRHGVLIQKDEQPAHRRIDHKHAFELD